MKRQKPKTTQQKPKIFIGSSAEGLPVARAIKDELDYDADCIIWNQAFFDLNLSTLEGLLKGIHRFDFGIFVFSPDDVIKVRGVTNSIPRDNVIFEFGLFVGKLGRSKTFVVRSEEPMRILTDLAGITVATYRSTSNSSELQANVGTACNAIRRAMEVATTKQEEKLVSKLSPNLLYVLRHIDSIGDTRPPSFYRRAAHHFLSRMGDPSAKLPLQERDGWDKASDYAFRYLECIGLIEKVTGSEYAITTLGKEVLKNKVIEARYKRAFIEPLLNLP